LGSFAAIRKESWLFCGSFLRKGEVVAYGGRIQNVKDPKAPKSRSMTSVTFFEKLLVENFCMQCSDAVVGLVKLSIFSQRRVSRRAVERCAKPDAMGLGES